MEILWNLLVRKYVAITKAIRYSKGGLYDPESLHIKNHSTQGLPSERIK